MKKKREKTIKHTISGVMLVTLVGKILGFVKELVLAHYFGASSLSDAYLISQTIPGTLFQIVGVGISTCFVPIYVKLKVENKRDEGIRFTNKFTTLMLGVSLCIILLVFLFAEYFVHIFAAGFDENTTRYACIFTRIVIWSLIFSVFVYVNNSLLQSEGKFLAYSLGVIPYNLGLIVAIWMGANINVYLLAIVSVIAVLVHLLYQFGIVKKLGYFWRPDFQFNDTNLKSAFSLLPPVVLGVAATEINILCDRTVASVVMQGGITIITYGTSLFNLVVGVFSQSISTIYYPSLTRAVAERNSDKLQNVVFESVKLIIFLLAPITIGGMMVSDMFVEMLFGRGALTKEHAMILANVFRVYSIGFIPYAFRQTLINVFYANKNAAIPMKNTCIGIVINIVLNVIMSRYWGLEGLALATVISSSCTAILLVVDVSRTYHIKCFQNHIMYIKYGIAVGLMSIGCGLCMYLFAEYKIINLCITIGCGMIIYFFVTYMLKVNLLVRKKEDV